MRKYAPTGMRKYVVLFLPFFLLVGAAAAQPKLEITPNPLDFGTVKVTTSRDLNLSIKNVSGRDIVIDYIGKLGLNQSDFQVVAPTTFPLSLPANATISAILRFKPTGTGAKSASVLIETSDGNIESPLSGIGTAPQANVRVIPSMVNFGKVAPGNAPVQIIKIFNDGPDSARFDTYQLQNDNGAVYFDVLFSLPEPVWVRKGDSLIFPVKFSSEIPTGTRTGRVILSGQFIGPSTIELKGETVQAELTFDKAEIDLGDVYVGETKDTFLIVNSVGEAALTISEFIDLSNGFKMVTQLPLPYVIQTGTSQRIELQFNPSIPGPAFNQFGVIAKGLAVGGNYRSVNIIANVLPNPVTLSHPGTLNYSCAIDTEKFVDYVFASRGKGQVSVSDITISDSRLTLLTSLPIDIAAGGSAPIRFSFKTGASNASGKAVIALMSGNVILATDTLAIEVIPSVDAFRISASTALAAYGHAVEIFAPSDLEQYHLNQVVLHVLSSSSDRSTIDPASFSLTPAIGAALLDVAPAADGYDLTITATAALVDASKGTAPIVTFSTKDFVSDSSMASLNLSASSVEAAECLSFTNTAAAIDLSTSCGDATLRSFLKKGNLFSIKSISPNPAQIQARLAIEAREKCSTMISIISPIGEVVYLDQAALKQGNNTLSLPTAQLSSGSYTVRIEATTGEALSIPLLILH